MGVAREYAKAYSQRRYDTDVHRNAIKSTKSWSQKHFYKQMKLIMISHSVDADAISTFA